MVARENLALQRMKREVMISALAEAIGVVQEALPHLSSKQAEDCPLTATVFLALLDYGEQERAGAAGRR